MTKVIWQTNSMSLYNSFSNRGLLEHAKGGVAYNYEVCRILSNRFDFRFDESTLRRQNENVLHYYYRISRNQTHADIFIKDQYIIALGKKKPNAKQIGVIHHINSSLGYKSLKWKWYLNQLKRRLLDLDIVVAVSKYWEAELRRIGCQKVKVIYNSFDLADFCFTSDEVEKFLIKYAIPLNKPLIYIGNASVQKGVVEVFNSLRNEDYSLVATGSLGKTVDIPVLHLDLNRRDYLRLLKASDVCITMSKMIEGWNRTAHEAMLCKTPVIGSGTGGMEELLTEGKQIVLRDYDDLCGAVERVLDKRHEIGERGFNYVKQYDLTYFCNQWASLLQ